MPWWNVSNKGADLSKISFWEPERSQLDLLHPHLIESGVSPIPRQPPHSKTLARYPQATNFREVLECGG
jgi:hypothetical protein